LQNCCKYSGSVYFIPGFVYTYTRIHNVEYFLLMSSLSSLSPEARHAPVMREACIEALQVQPDKLYVDGTLGMGGHSEALLQTLHALGEERPQWVGVDQDAAALAMAKERLKPALLPFKAVEGLRFLQANYSEISQRLPVFGIQQINGGLLLDLGVSSYQLDTPERGFSFQTDGPLDMRMDATNAQLMTADILLNTASEQELLHILETYGEERYAYPIVQAIIQDRAHTPWNSTLALAQLVERVYKAKQRGGKGLAKETKHPATRTFQALRMAVNRELEHLETLLHALPALMLPGSRVAIMTFHSLEDRLVKQTFKKWAGACVCPPRYPICQCTPVMLFQAITRKPLEATAEEVAANSRARSARLRVYERA
jgi:16S rRNA (cytosine1402-N4)-methyltransferase